MGNLFPDGNFAFPMGTIDFPIETLALKIFKSTFDLWSDLITGVI